MGKDHNFNAKISHLKKCEKYIIFPQAFFFSSVSFESDRGGKLV